MSLQDLGSIGEFIASIGVVVSLVYLALQTRANTSAVKAQTRSSLTDQVLTIQIATFQNEAYRIAYQKALSGHALDPMEEDLLRREALLYFKHMENAQFQHDEGLHDAAEYGAQINVWKVRFENHKFWRDAWHQFGPTLSPRLASKVQPIVDEAERNASLRGG